MSAPTGEALPSAGRAPVNADRIREFGIVVALGVLLLAATIGVNDFASASNITEILRSVALTGIVAVGMTLVVISGNLVDLSVPSVVAVAGLLALGAQDMGAVAAVAIALGAAVVIGIGNGFLIGYLDGNPVIVTLGVGSIVAGFILVATNGGYSYGSSHVLEEIGRAKLGGIPIQVAFLVIAMIIGQFLLSRTRYGFSVTCIGANRSAARLSGIRDRSTTLWTFVITAFCAGFAGVMIGINSGSVNSTIGVGYEFQALTAVVVGGCSLFGGSGSVWRTFVGVVFVGVLNNAMILVGLPFPMQQIVEGALIAAAVSLDVWLRADSFGELIGRG